LWRFAAMNNSSSRASASRMNFVLFLLGLSVVINYIDRSNLSIAAPLIKDELGISASQLGTLLSAFFWTYSLMQIPAGWLVDRFDVKWIFAAGFFIWSAATVVTGVLHGFAALLAIRVVLGVGESVAFPGYGKILCERFQETRRGFGNGVITAGLALGPAIGMLVGGSAVGRFGWRPFFVALGLIGMLWLAPWWKWMPRQEARSAHKSERQAGVVDILQQRSAWGTCISLFSLNYCLYLLVTWLPFYLVRERHLSMNQMARVGGMVFLLCAASSLTFGRLSDRWIAAGSSPTKVRKGLTIAGSLGFGIFLAATAVAPQSMFVWTLALVGVFNGMAGSNIWAITQILAGPRTVGRWTGVQNFVGNLAGAVSPALTGFLLDRTGHFVWPFFIAAGIISIGAFSWVFVVGPVEEVVWGKDVLRPLKVSAYPAPQSPLP
jgi:ACS family D-galactonate transporter-like MFS transporter